MTMTIAMKRTFITLLEGYARNVDDMRKHSLFFNVDVVYPFGSSSKAIPIDILLSDGSEAFCNCFNGKFVDLTTNKEIDNVIGWRYDATVKKCYRHVQNVKPDIGCDDVERLFIDSRLYRQYKTVSIRYVPSSPSDNDSLCDLLEYINK